MDQTLDQIEDEIGRTRQRLGSNLQELEARVDAATDWREYYRAAPFAYLGAAAVGGVVAAWMAGRKRTARRVPKPEPGFGSSSLRDSKLGGQVLDTWDGVQHALVGVAAAKITDYLSDLVPGFREHYQRRL
jgi:hypothetical protein